MAYSKQTWSDNNPTYPLSAARMGVIEQGIFDAAAVADQGHRILTTSAKNALTGVVTGTQVYDSTLGQHQTYNGSAWVGVAGLVPLVPTGQTSPYLSFTGAASVVVDGVFSSTYTNYRIFFNMAGASVGSFLQVQMRSASGADGTSNYTQSEFYVLQNGTYAAVNFVASARWYDWYYGTANPNAHFVLDLAAPNEARTTSGTSQWHGWDGGQNVSRFMGHYLGTSTQYTGFQIIPNSGTITGAVAVYGYAKF